MASSSRLEFIVSQEVRNVCDHWRSLLVGTVPPARDKLDPAKMKRSLPFLWIAEKQWGVSGRYVLRLAGEAVNRLFGESLRHRFIDDIFPAPVAAEVTQKFDKVVETPALVWTLGPFFDALSDGPTGECAVVPLVADSGGQALMGVTVPKGAMRMPPRRLFPLSQESRILSLAELASGGS